jgi:hypothetical protein
MRASCWCAVVGAALLGLAVAAAPKASAAGVSKTTAAGCPGGHSGGFLAGQLVEVSTTQLLLRPAPSCPAPVAISLAPTTQVCVRTCAASWRDLQPGDQVEVGLLPASNPTLVARWVDANPVAGRGRISAIQGATVTVALTQGQPGSVRMLEIQSSTIVVEANGTTEMGQPGPLRVGDHVYFTGTSDVLGSQLGTIWAYRLFQFRTADPTPRLPVAGAGGLISGDAAPRLAGLIALVVLGATKLSRAWR